MNEEIIKILDYIGSKFGVAIDWTDKNVTPYLQELHDLYYPDQIMPLPSSSGYFCSPDTTIMERKVNGKSKYLKEELLKKQELITHALQVDENMSSEAVFKLLNSYGLTDECGKVLPVTGELICNLLELPENEKLF